MGGPHICQVEGCRCEVVVGLCRNHAPKEIVANSVDVKFDNPLPNSPSGMPTFIYAGLYAKDLKIDSGVS